MDFVRVYDVHTQAREKLFDWIRPLSHEDYTREFPYALRTLQVTMIELASTELWLAMRLREEPMPRPFIPEQLPINETEHGRFPDLEAAWRKLALETRATLETTKDWDKVVQTVIYGRKRTVTLTAARKDIATQLLLHEVHHRAQAMSMLRQLGVPAQDVDYISFVQERREEPVPFA